MRYFSDTNRYRIALDDYRAGAIGEDEFDEIAEHFQCVTDERKELYADKDI